MWVCCGNAMGRLARRYSSLGGSDKIGYSKRFKTRLGANKHFEGTIVNISVDDVVVFALKSLGKLPLPVVRRLGFAVGWLFSLLPSTAKRVTAINVALCFPEKSPAHQRSLVRRSLIETVVTGFEMGPIWAGDAHKALARITAIEGDELIREAQAQGRGVIILAPHLGNWEMISYYLSSRYEFAAMFQPGEHPKLNELILQAREQLSATLVPTDKRGVMGLLRRLKKGGMTGILPDQKPERTSGVLAPFFGVPALTQTLGPKLASQTNAVLIGGVCFRDYTSNGYRLFFLPVDAAAYDADLEKACAAMNRSIAEWVLMCPEQYQWEYKRFGRRPAPYPDVYRKR
ncbi:Lipid A biosynthesis lauroyl acyltransferase [gamma proteobacterium HdN1]|nr:Lipid A biosynthesis lauroyl acyltransferase [gamma proteobacterium HdN1]